MKKVLFTATVDSHILNFHTPFLKYFRDEGYEVHVASNGDSQIPSTDYKHNVSFERSPYKINNIRAYRELKKIINNNNFDIIHCHTPMGAALTRLAAKECRKNGTKIIYTAHGFHFFKGAPVINWLLFYPVEKWLSKYTDVLITINNEDYTIAKKKFKCSDIQLINGVGVDIEKFPLQTSEGKYNQRIEYGYNPTDFILIYVGELSYRKHQDLLIQVVSYLKEKIPGIKLLLAGNGEKLTEYQNMATMLNVNNNVEFLGYRKDISKLMMMSDVAVSSSRQEGLPINVMEAMATGLPVVVTGCRGNRDLISDQENGFVVNIDNKKIFADRIYSIYKDRELCDKFRLVNIDNIQKYSINKISYKYIEVYKKIKLNYNL